MTSRSFFVSALIIVFTCVAACGDDGRPTDTGAGDTGTPDTGGGDSAPADTGTMDTGTADTGSADTGGGDTSAPDASPDGGTSDVVITEVSVAAWANCMPIVPADPLRFFVELSYDNTMGSAEALATISTARLTFDDGAASTTEIDLDVKMVTIAAGATEVQTHTKTTSSPVLDSCSICSSERMVTYELTMDIGGAMSTVTGTTSFGCTF